jgi:hypothetical protein
MVQNNGAAAVRQLAKTPLEHLQFPGEDGGQSLAAWARRDLEATLQLLADRAQYITGGSGAAIALRDGDVIMCRASSGPSAPRIGSCFEVSSGLSGESVRTKRMLRCDDAAKDPRVNYDSCKALNIASFAVMPLIRYGEVIGIFEVFSSQPRAFQERDLLALERMGEMVNTALDQVKGPNSRALSSRSQGVARAADTAVSESAASASLNSSSAASLAAQSSQEALNEALKLDHSLLFASKSEDLAPRESKANPYPAALGISTCTNCGFPVSGGRKFCLDCEAAVQKPQPAAAANTETPAFLADLEAEKTGFKHWIISHRYLLGTIVMTLATLLVLFLR